MKFDKRLEDKEILLVEDSYDSARFLKIFLERAGAHVNWIECPQKALSSLDNDSVSYDFIISDLSLPVMSGYEFCRLAKLNQKSNKAVFVAFSGHDNDGKSQQFGFSSHIVKPCEPEEFIEKLILLLPKSE